MSGKAQQKPPKVSKVPACFATVSLTIRNVENTKFLVDDFAELGIEAKFHEKLLKCKNLTERLEKVESNVSATEVSGRVSEVSTQVPPKMLADDHFAPSEADVVFNYEIQVDINNEPEIFEFFQNPVQCKLTHEL